MITQKYATYGVGSDRYPFEVIRVISDKTIEVREMDFKMAKGGDWFGNQVWEFSSNPEREVIRIRLRKHGRWMKAGATCGSFALCDEPRAYQDPSF